MIYFPPIQNTTFRRRRRRGQADIRHHEIMARLLAERGTKCHWCKVVTTPPHASGHHEPTTRTRDHLIAVAEGGPDTCGNSRIACAECNQQRGRATADKVFHDRLHIIAPNRLFGCYIRGGEGI